MLIKSKEELEQKLTLFTDTFKQYEKTHNNEEEKKIMIYRDIKIL